MSSFSNTKTHIRLSVTEPQPAKKMKLAQAQSKRKRTLSVYNIFYQEMCRKILEERGYVEVLEDIRRSESPPRKRGRPRGPNYQKNRQKKKTPHNIISFTDLTKEIAVRWQYCKDEYHAKHGATVEEERRKIAAEKNEAKKVKLMRTESSKSSACATYFGNSCKNHEDEFPQHDCSATKSQDNVVCAPESQRCKIKSKLSMIKKETNSHSL